MYMYIYIYVRDEGQFALKFARLVLRVLSLFKEGVTMVHLRRYFWRSSQDCHNLFHLLLHLRLHGGPLHQVVANAAEFLKPPELHFAAYSQTAPGIQSTAFFGRNTYRSVEVALRPEASIIACDLAREVLVVAWSDSTMEVIVGHDGKS